MKIISILLFVLSLTVFGQFDVEGDGDSKIVPGKVYRLDKNHTYNIKVGQTIIIRFEDEELQLTFSNPKNIDENDQSIESVDYKFQFKGKKKLAGEKVSFVSFTRIKKDGVISLVDRKGSQTIKYGKIKLEWSYNSDKALWLYMKKG